MVSKLATFRTDSDIWDSFQDKAKANGTNASALLQRYVRDYLDDKIDNRIDSPAAAPDVDIESIVNDAIASKLSTFEGELESIKTTIDKVTKEFLRHRDLEIDDLKARVTDLEATAPANFTQALLQRAKEVAPLKLKEVA